MMRPVLRVTQVEQFRKWVSGEYDYVTEQAVIDSLSGEFKGNDRTRIGTAFHSVVENGDSAGEPVEGGRAFDIDGFRIILDESQREMALAYRDEFPRAFHEVRLRKDYGEAIVSGCADMVVGTELRDIKTRFSHMAGDMYSGSCQGMFYMDMFGAVAFHYDVFEFGGYKEGTDARGLTLRRLDPLTVYAPMAREDLESDNRRLVREFMAWIRVRGIEDLVMREVE